MKLADLFVARSQSGRPCAIDVFTTPQSVAAFPLATCLVATMTRAARTIGHADAEVTMGVGLVTALCVGLSIFAIGARAADAKPRSTREWLTRSGIAFVNSILVYAAAIGIEKF